MENESWAWPGYWRNKGFIVGREAPLCLMNLSFLHFFWISLSNILLTPPDPLWGCFQIFSLLTISSLISSLHNSSPQSSFLSTLLTFVVWTPKLSHATNYLHWSILFLCFSNKTELLESETGIQACGNHSTL